MIRIDHEKYGVEAEFESIAEAIEAIGDCGDSFENTKIRVRLDGQVEDQDGDVVGEEI